MRELEYLPIDQVDHSELLALLNKPKIRQHLMAHPLFNERSVQDWIAAKQAANSMPGCRVRAITQQQQLVGWCGIQFEDGQHEIAIVLDDCVWGAGKRVFREIMGWAVEFKLNELVIHLLDTRPESRFLVKRATRVARSQLYNYHHTTYYLPVPNGH